MKTTIDIPMEELQQLLEFTGAATKREAVVTAVKEFNRHQRMAKLATILGSFEDFMEPEELPILRQDEHG